MQSPASQQLKLTYRHFNPLLSNGNIRSSIVKILSKNKKGSKRKIPMTVVPYESVDDESLYLRHISQFDRGKSFRQ